MRIFVLGFIIFWMFVPSLYARNGIYTTLDSGFAIQSGLPDAASVGALRSTHKAFPSTIRVGIGYNHDLFARLGIGLDIAAGWYGHRTYDFTTTSVNFYSRTLEFLAFLQFHHNKLIDLVLKVGGVRQTMVITGGQAFPNQTQINPKVAFGTFFNITQEWAVSLQYARIFGKKILNFEQLQSKTPTVDVILIGLRYHF